jgi:hypothetical protein
MPKRVYSHAYASIRFMGPTLDPLDVTKSLLLPPDHQHRDGEPRIRRSRNRGLRQYADYRGGMWSMSSKECVESPVLETHVDWLLGEIEPLTDRVRELLADGIEVDIFCYSMGASEIGPSLSKATRKRAESLGITIEIDHYVE